MGTDGKEYQRCAAGYSERQALLHPAFRGVTVAFFLKAESAEIRESSHRPVND